MPALAADITVDATCTLADAITIANGDPRPEASQCENGSAGSGAAGHDTIILAGDLNLTADLPNVTSDITFAGNNHTINGVGGGSVSMFFITGDGVEVVINDLTVRLGGSRSTHGGGGILITNSAGESSTVTLNRVTITRSASVLPGGGISCANANLTINDSVISHNEQQGSSGSGGGLYINCAATINRSAIHNNSASGSDGGGGILVDSAGSLTMTNSTVYANSTAAGAGGGIRVNASSSTFALRHVTLTGNTGQHYGGVYFFSRSGSVVFRNSIFYGNSSDNDSDQCSAFSSDLVSSSTFENNIIGTGSSSYLCRSAGASGSSDNPMLPSAPEGSPPYFALPANSPAVNAAGDCTALTTEDQRGASRPSGGACDIGAYEYQASPMREEPSAPSVSASRASAPSVSWVAPTAMPRVSTCLTLDGLWVDGITESTQCQRLPGYAIGNDAIVAAGFVDAIDVWGWVLPDTQICLFVSGSAFKFIDTAVLPRVVYDWPAYSQNGMTCATIDGPGILVLLPGEPPPAPAAAVPSVSLSNCMVRTLNMLNFRAAPGGESIGGVPYDATLTALEKSSGWFKVDYHGTQGWISAEHVETKGTCG